MEEVIWKLQELKKNGGFIKNAKYVLVNSAPPYFGRPNLEQLS